MWRQRWISSISSMASKKTSAGLIDPNLDKYSGKIGNVEPVQSTGTIQ
jgi:hypothetical protein